MNSSSGVSSYGFSNQYTFSNLPSFMTSKRNNEEKELNNHDKVELPFIPTKRFPVNNEFFSRLPSGPDREPHRRVWSAGSDHHGKLFNDRRNFVEKDEDEVVVDAQAEFVKLGENFISLILLLGKKSGLWVIWLLNLVFDVLVGKLRQIPDPLKREREVVEGKEEEENKEREKEREEKVVIAESTPVKEVVKEVNPLFQKKLRGVKSLREKLERAVESEEEESNGYKGEDRYGTHFYERPSKGVNLEACFMKSSMRESPIVSEEDLYSKAENIRNDLMMLSELGDNRKIESKPSFTRSTKRFEDLEWLIDEEEDYLNNLESTRLYQEYQKILGERKKMRQLVELKKMKDREEVKGLKREQVLEVEEIWEEPPNGSLIKRYGVNIEGRDILTLCDRHWLNDNIIDFYLQLVKEEIVNKKICTMHVFSTFFYTNLKDRGYEGVRRWAKRAKIDVSTIDYIFIPMNLNGTHWALSVVDNIRERIIYIDSLFSDGSEALELILNYMKEETRRVYGDGMNGKNYDLYTIDGNFECPNQENGFDCGVFVCTAVDYIARGKSLTYSQKDMGVIRRRMAWEIMHGELVEH